MFTLKFNEHVHSTGSEYPPLLELARTAKITKRGIKQVTIDKDGFGNVYRRTLGNVIETPWRGEPSAAELEFERLNDMGRNVTVKRATS